MTLLIKHHYCFGFLTWRKNVWSQAPANYFPWEDKFLIPVILCWHDAIFYLLLTHFSVYLYFLSQDLVKAFVSSLGLCHFANRLRYAWGRHNPYIVVWCWQQVTTRFHSIAFSPASLPTKLSFQSIPRILPMPFVHAIPTNFTCLLPLLLECLRQ